MIVQSIHLRLGFLLSLGSAPSNEAKANKSVMLHAEWTIIESSGALFGPNETSIF